MEPDIEIIRIPTCARVTVAKNPVFNSVEHRFLELGTPI